MSTPTHRPAGSKEPIPAQREGLRQVQHRAMIKLVRPSWPRKEELRGDQEPLRVRTAMGILSAWRCGNPPTPVCPEVNGRRPATALASHRNEVSGKPPPGVRQRYALPAPFIDLIEKIASIELITRAAGIVRAQSETV
jgi:hypothetical protein